VVRAVHSEGPIVIPDVAGWLPIPDLQPWPRGVSSLAAVPLCPEERGGCLLVTSAAPREFTRVEMEGLALVAAQTTQSIGYLHQATAVRDHLARELHDTVTQTLTLLAFSLDELLVATHDHPSHGVAAIARTHATSALLQVRHLMGHADGGEGVLARLRRIVLELTRSGIEVRINGTLSDDSLPEPVSDSLLHIAHEALMNVRRHAAARLVTLVFKRGPGSAWLVISDDGLGSGGHHRTHGHGIAIMQDRARRLGGTTTIRARSSGGTVVTARIPLAP
jgi:signal transduction histidine kinase